MCYIWTIRSTCRSAFKKTWTGLNLCIEVIVSATRCRVYFNGVEVSYVRLAKASSTELGRWMWEVLMSEGSTRGNTQVVSTNYYVFQGNSEGVWVYISRDQVWGSLAVTTGLYTWEVAAHWLCIPAEWLCNAAHILLRTVHYCGLCLRRSRLRRLCNCAAREWSVWKDLTYRDRGWLRLGLRHFVKQLSRESREDCTWCVTWGLQWRMHVIMFVGNTRLYEHLFRHLFGRLRRKRIGVSKACRMRVS